MCSDVLTKLSELTIADDIQNSQNAYSKLNYFKNNGHDEPKARLAAKAIHAETLPEDTVYTIPSITSDNTIYLLKEDIITVTDLADATPTEIAAIPTLTKPQAKCVIELAENEINRIPTTVSEIAGKAGVSRQRVHNAYKNLVEYTHTSFETVTPQNSREFLIEHFTNTDNTAVCNFDEFPLGMRKLLYENGFESAEHVLSADTSRVSSIEYSNRRDNQNTISNPTVTALKQTARYRLHHPQNRKHTLDDSDSHLPSITDMMTVVTYETGLQRRDKQIRVAVQLLRGAQELQLSKDEAVLAGNIFSEAHKKELTTGTELCVVIGAAHRIAMLKHDSPRPWSAITGVYNINQSLTSKKVRELTKALQDTAITITPRDITYTATDCIPYLLRELQNQHDSYDVTAEQIKDAVTNAEKTWTNPWSGAASATYATLKNKGIKITQSEVSEVSGISNGTIQETYQQFMTP